MEGEQFISLLQRIFASLIGVNPKDVTVGKDALEKGMVSHECRWQHGDSAVEGKFYRDDMHSGAFCITRKVESGKVDELGSWYTWQHVFGADELVLS